jgi:hypothetical protein
LTQIVLRNLGAERQRRVVWAIAGPPPLSGEGKVWSKSTRSRCRLTPFPWLGNAFNEGSTIPNLTRHQER